MARKPSTGFRKICVDSEGLYLEAYPDPASPLGKLCTKRGLFVTKYKQISGWETQSGTPWTIGVGHTGKVDGVPVKPGMTITEDKAYQLLEEDAASAAASVEKLVKVSINQNQFDALVDFVFNLGATNFAGSTLLRKLNSGDPQGASLEFVKWNKAGGQVLAGLTKRRELETKLFQS